MSLRFSDEKRRRSWQSRRKRCEPEALVLVWSAAWESGNAGRPWHQAGTRAVAQTIPGHRRRAPR